MESSIQLQAVDIERRFREYQNDSFIKGCINQINKIVGLSTPRIIVYLQKDRNDDVFDIDEESKKQINFWQNRINEHRKEHYSDIFR